VLDDMNSATYVEECIVFSSPSLSPIEHHPSKDSRAEAECSTPSMTTSSVSAADTSEPRSSPGVPPYAPGDHVYQWCTMAGIPVFHHHAIVMQVYWDECDDLWMLHVSDFSNTSLHEAGGGRIKKNRRPYSHTTTSLSNPGGCMLLSNPFASTQTPGGWRSYASPACRWKKVVYKASFWEKIKNPSPGTSTGAECDPPGVVQARVRFLQEHSATLLDMPYHWAHSNCEAAAVWCKTGSWCTLQAQSLLAYTAARQAESAVVLAGTAAATQVSVTTPAAGFWGWMGYTTTTQVPLLVSQPYLIGVLAAYGVLTVGVPAAMILKAKSEWKQTTVRLNDAFWGTAALERPEVFVEYINCYYKKHNSG
jgi:hypothetical protein